MKVASNWHNTEADLHVRTDMNGIADWHESKLDVNLERKQAQQNLLFFASFTFSF